MSLFVGFLGTWLIFGLGPAAGLIFIYLMYMGLRTEED